MLSKLRHGIFMLLEKLLRWAIHPGLRASLLRLFGADIGAGVRIHEIQLFNLSLGFRNLHIGDDVFVGIGCKLDLEGPLTIGARTSLSCGVTVLTHDDAGARQHSRLSELFPKRVGPTVIGSDCWIGANATVVRGVTIGNCAVVGAGSVITRDVPEQTMAAGVPASPRHPLAVP